MQLRPVRFLWKQLNGPQVTAFMTAVFKYLQGLFNGPISYLTTFKIATATESHLTFIGMCMGVIRPIVSLANAYEFLFTSEAESDKTYGFSQAPGPLQIGGIFSDLYEDIISRKNVLCPAEYYRAILQGCADSTSGELFSIKFIDDFLYSIWHNYHPDLQPTYTITWLDRTYPDQEVMYEDVQIDLGDLTMWGTQETAIIWQAVLEGIINNIWAPTRKVQVKFS